MIITKIFVVIPNGVLYNSYIGRLRPPRVRRNGKKTALGLAVRQFNSYVRFVLPALKDMLEETDEQKKAAEAKELMENLQTTLDD